MSQKMFQNTVESRFIKSLLSNTPLPIYDVVQDYDYIIDSMIYTHGCNIIKCTKTGYLGKDATFDLVDEFTLGEYNPKYSYKFYSLTNEYDSYTHKELGNFIRAYKGKTGVNLLPFYNCWCGEYISNLVVNDLGVTTHKDSAYKTLIVPIRFDTVYTIVADTPSNVKLVPVFLRNNSLLKVDVGASEEDLTEKLFKLNGYKQLSSMSYKDPKAVEISLVDMSEYNKKLFKRHEKYLNLMIQFASSTTTTFVALEGNYTNNECYKIYNAQDQTKLISDKIQYETMLNPSEWTANEDNNIAVINNEVTSTILPYDSSDYKFGVTHKMDNTLDKDHKYLFGYNINRSNIVPMNISYGSVRTEHINNLTLTGNSTQVTTTGVNLFNKNSITRKAYISNTDGLVHESTQSTTPYCASDYMILPDDATYIYITATGQTASRYGAFYDTDKKYLSGFTFTADTYKQVPTGAKYVRATFNVMCLDLVQVSATRTKQQYEEFSNGFASPSINYAQDVISNDDVYITPTEGNLFGGDAFANLAIACRGTFDKETRVAQIPGNSLQFRIFYDKFKPNTQYTLFLSGYNSSSTSNASNLTVYYDDGTSADINFLVDDKEGIKVYVSKEGKTITKILGRYISGVSYFNVDRCGLMEGVHTVDEFVPYTHKITYKDTELELNLAIGTLNVTTGDVTTASSGRYNVTKDIIPLQQGKRYKVKILESTHPIKYYGMAYYYLDGRYDKRYAQQYALVNNEFVITVPYGYNGMRFRFDTVSSYSTVSIKSIKIYEIVDSESIYFDYVLRSSSGVHDTIDINPDGTGTFTQRIRHFIDQSGSWSTTYFPTVIKSFTAANYADSSKKNYFCNYFDKSLLDVQSNGSGIKIDVTGIFDTADDFVAFAQAKLAENKPITIDYVLKEPVVTQLSKEQVQMVLSINKITKNTYIVNNPIDVDLDYKWSKSPEFVTESLTQIDNEKTNTWYEQLGCLTTSTDSVNTLEVYPVNSEVVPGWNKQILNAGDTYKLKNLYTIDLTKLYGAGLEPNIVTENEFNNDIDLQMQYTTYYNYLVHIKQEVMSYISSPEKIHEAFIDQALTSQLSLLQLSTLSQYPYADTLIQYLIDNVITNVETIENNVKFAQSYIGKQTGIWTIDTRRGLYTKYMNNKNVPHIDVTGYVDKNMESAIIAGGNSNG